jgi:Ca2+-binding EF-hand superfamily protein
MKKFTILAVSTALSLCSFLANADEHANKENKEHKKWSFEERDIDGNGSISKEEFMTPKNKISKYDKDGDGKMNEAEFIEKHKERFAKMDSNKDGFLTKEEKESYKEEREDKKEEREDKKEEHMKKKEGKFNEIDADKNGKITKEELEAYRASKKADKKADEKPEAEKTAE